MSCGFFRELQLDLCFWFSTLSSLSPTTFLQNHHSFPPLNNNSPHTPHEHAENAVNDNTLAFFLFATPHHHFTRPSLPSHSPPRVLTAHSPCPTTAHGVTNDVMQTPLVLRLTHIFSSSLSTLNTLIQLITLAVLLVVHLPYSCHSVDHQWLGKRGVVHAMCCHSTPFTLAHPFALLTHSVCVFDSHSVSTTFTSE